MTGVAGLVLAAGAGSRFGEEPKLLAELDGRPVLQHVVDAAVTALPRVVVVLGARAGAVRGAVDLAAAQVVVCDGWSEGLAASLRCGLQAIDEEKVVLLLGDQPRVTPALVERLAGEPGGTRAAYGGTPAHPAVLGPGEIAAARRLTGDEGLRSIQWRLVEAGRPLRDIDTPDDLEAVRREARAIL